MRTFLVLIALVLPSCAFLSGCSYHAPLRVAVLNFENSTGDPTYDFLEQALPEYLIARLSNTNSAILLERQAPRVWGEDRTVTSPFVVKAHTGPGVLQAPARPACSEPPQGCQ